MSEIAFDTVATRRAWRFPPVLTALRGWRRRRREERELQLAAERLSRLSPHLLDDIGLGGAAGLSAEHGRVLPSFGRT